MDGWMDGWMDGVGNVNERREKRKMSRRQKASHDEAGGWAGAREMTEALRVRGGEV